MGLRHPSLVSATSALKLSRCKAPGSRRGYNAYWVRSFTATLVIHPRMTAHVLANLSRKMFTGLVFTFFRPCYATARLWSARHRLGLPVSGCCQSFEDNFLDLTLPAHLWAEGPIIALPPRQSGTPPSAGARSCFFSLPRLAHSGLLLHPETALRY